MALLIPLLALAASAATDRPVGILVRDAGAGRCSVRIEGRIYTTSRDGARIGAHLAALKARNLRATIVAHIDVPYRCVGGIIYEAQRLGLSVGFIAEPPPVRRPIRSGS